MRCILRKETDPYFNLAAEEYVFRNFEDDTFMLWRNLPSVIIGKHQNAFAEVNYQYIKDHDIKVVRRISGGGAVYHDLGNLNFTFTAKCDKNNLVDFSRYLHPIINVITKLGVEPVQGLRNNLYIDGKKISGNAEHVYKEKVIHHGTLLFNSNLENLERSIKQSHINYEDKAVKSTRSTVVNISECIKQQLNIEDFESFIMKEMMHSFKDTHLYQFTNEDIAAINKLKIDKYITWQWNYGYSPAFKFKTHFNVNEEQFDAEVLIKDGLIENIQLIDVVVVTSPVKETLNYIIGIPLNESIVAEKLGSFVSPRQIELIIQSLFTGSTAEHLQNPNV